jgi:hypothetical protein
MLSEKRFIRNNETISGRLHDELVMMDIQKGKYFALNPVATRIWDLLEKPLAHAELCSLLVEEYEVEEGGCSSDLQEYLEEMVGLGLVKVDRELQGVVFQKNKGK